MMNNVNYIKAMLSVAGGLITQYLGGYDAMLSLFAWLVMTDFLLGCLGGIKAKNFSLAIALWGFVTKFAYFVIIALCVKIDVIMGKEFFVRNIAIIWFALCEGASVLEKVARLGVPLPAGLVEVLVQAKKGFSIRVTDVVKKIVLEYSGKQEESEDE